MAEGSVVTALIASKLLLPADLQASEPGKWVCVCSALTVQWRRAWWCCPHRQGACRGVGRWMLAFLCLSAAWCTAPLSCKWTHGRMLCLPPSHEQVPTAYCLQCLLPRLAPTLAAHRSPAPPSCAVTSGAGRAGGPAAARARRQSPGERAMVRRVGNSEASGQWCCCGPSWPPLDRYICSLKMVSEAEAHNSFPPESCTLLWRAVLYARQRLACPFDPAPHVPHARVLSPTCKLPVLLCRSARSRRTAPS